MIQQLSSSPYPLFMGLLRLIDGLAALFFRLTCSGATGDFFLDVVVGGPVARVLWPVGLAAGVPILLFGFLSLKNRTHGAQLRPTSRLPTISYGPALLQVLLILNLATLLLAGLEERGILRLGENAGGSLGTLLFLAASGQAMLPELILSRESLARLFLTGRADYRDAASVARYFNPAQISAGAGAAAALGFVLLLFALLLLLLHRGGRLAVHLAMAGYTVSRKEAGSFARWRLTFLTLALRAMGVLLSTALWLRLAVLLLAGSVRFSADAYADGILKPWLILLGTAALLAAHLFWDRKGIALKRTLASLRPGDAAIFLAGMTAVTACFLYGGAYWYWGGFFSLLLTGVLLYDHNYQYLPHLPQYLAERKRFALPDPLSDTSELEVPGKVRDFLRLPGGGSEFDIPLTGRERFLQIVRAVEARLRERTIYDIHDIIPVTAIRGGYLRFGGLYRGVVLELAATGITSQPLWEISLALGGAVRSVSLILQGGSGYLALFGGKRELELAVKTAIPLLHETSLSPALLDDEGLARFLRGWYTPSYIGLTDRPTGNLADWATPGRMQFGRNTVQVDGIVVRTIAVDGMFSELPPLPGARIAVQLRRPFTGSRTDEHSGPLSAEAFVTLYAAPGKEKTVLSDALRRLRFAGIRTDSMGLRQFESYVRAGVSSPDTLEQRRFFRPVEHRKQPWPDIEGV